MTPMMRQYLEIKERHADSLLLYRMGDFYELFNEDAVIASRVLGLTLTARNHGGDGGTPLAGFPHHAIERYMPKLLASGHKVAVCEQVEDPKDAKGVVKREVTELVTRGTALSENFLEEKTGNYLAALHPPLSGGTLWGFSGLDLSTADFFAMEGGETEVLEEIERLSAGEILFPEGLPLPSALEVLKSRDNISVTVLPKGYFHEEDGRKALSRQFKVFSLEAFGAGHLSVGIRTAAAALQYVRENKKTELTHLVRLEVRSFDAFLTLDASTVRNLELLKPIHGEDETGTLIRLLDRTCTAMGGRKLKHWLTHPLLDIPAITERQDAIVEVLEDAALAEALCRTLRGIGDIERMVARAGAGRANARDLLGLGESLLKAAEAGELLAPRKSRLLREAGLALLPLREKGEYLVSRFTERPPLTVREGGMVRPGVDAELDFLVESIREGREFINGLQEAERKRTGIPSLKVGYNKVFGYYIEVTKAHEDKVPPEYLRKQSLVGGERYITPEMKDWESRILSAEGRINQQEYRVFCALRDAVAEEAALFQGAARLLGETDALASLAEVAKSRGFTRPEIVEGPVLDIQGGRHPVVEALAPEGSYIENDARLSAAGGGTDRQILLVTGPNMAGKSTYLRQVGLIALLGQVGSLVPARRAKLGLTDRIFTRVGAADRLARGQSTFMVEMIETAHILRHATPRSLVLLDEIGRGTSTYDGLSLAWAIVEELHQNRERAARTLFATHYHELPALAERLPRLHNVQVTVREAAGEVLFLRRVVEGACDSSYGIQVARMAGVPEPVIERAREILAALEKSDIEDKGTRRPGRPVRAARSAQELAAAPRQAETLDLFAAPSVDEAEVRALREFRDAVLALDPLALPPLLLAQKVAEIRERFARPAPGTAPP